MLVKKQGTGRSMLMYPGAGKSRTLHRECSGGVADWRMWRTRDGALFVAGSTTGPGTWAPCKAPFNLFATFSKNLINSKTLWAP